MKIFLIAASRNPVASVNRSLARIAADHLRSLGHDVDLSLDFREFDMPLYDDEACARGGLPAGAKLLQARTDAADAVIFASPEYNSSIPGFLKNAIDWLSTLRPMPWFRKPVYLMSATPSVFGGIKGTTHLRQSLEYTGALIFPDSFQLAHASTAFDATSGKLASLPHRQRLEKQLEDFATYAAALLKKF